MITRYIFVAGGFAGRPGKVGWLMGEKYGVRPMAAVILAGGQSRRMGKDKPALALGKGTLLTHAIDLYRPFFEELAVSVNQLGRYDTAGVREITDTYQGIGPLGGLHAALRALPGRAILFAAADLPYADPALALALFERLAGHDACGIMRKDGYFEPLFAVYTDRCLPAVEACIARGEYALRSIYRHVDLEVVGEEALPQFDMEKLFRNVNTPEEYEAARRYFDV